jgi:hypothetical protein
MFPKQTGEVFLHPRKNSTPDCSSFHPRLFWCVDASHQTSPLRLYLAYKGTVVLRVFCVKHVLILALGYITNFVYFYIRISVLVCY